MGQQYQQEQTAANATTGESIENRGEREKVENVAAAAAKDDVVINRLLLCDGGGVKASIEALTC